MLWPTAHGAFETWQTLEPSLMPIIKDWAGGLFMPWTLANARALARPDEEFDVKLRGVAWRQKPQKYHAKSLDALRAKYNAVKDRGVLDAILDEASVRLGLIA